MSSAQMKQLGKVIQSGDTSAIVEAANKVLSSEPDNVDAARAKATAYVHADNWQAAWETLEAPPLSASVSRKLDASLALITGYVLYKMGKLSDASKVLETALKGGKGTAPLHLLLGQVRYKAEEWTAASEALNKAKGLDSDLASSPEFLTNLGATYIAGGAVTGAAADAVFRDSKVTSATHELAFNAASAAIAQRDYRTAKKLLASAKDIAMESMTGDDWTEEEIADELLPIETQAAYTAQAAGFPKDAQAGYDAVLESLPGHASVTSPAAAVAINNAVVLMGGRDKFEGAKMMKRISSPALEAKLTSAQVATFRFNSALLALHMNKLDIAVKQTDALAEANPDSEWSVLLRAAIAIKSGKKTDAEKTLADYAKSHPEASERVQLTLAQMHRAQGKMKEAIADLNAIPTLQVAPGMIATLVNLHNKLGDAEGAAAVWTNAISVQEKAVAAGTAGARGKINLIRLLRQAGKSLIKTQSWEAAAAVFERLLAQDAKDTGAIAHLVMCYSQTDPSKAEKYDARLPPVDKPDQSVAELEAAALSTRPVIKKATPPPPEPASVASSGSDAAAAAGDANGDDAAAAAASDAATPVKKVKTDQEKEKKKKKRKPRLPKGADPDKPPTRLDPERWVPKNMRRSAGKRRFKVSMGSGAHQGGVVSAKAAARLDQTLGNNSGFGNVVEGSARRPKGGRRR